MAPSPAQPDALDRLRRDRQLEVSVAGDNYSISVTWFASPLYVRHMWVGGPKVWSCLLSLQIELKPSRAISVDETAYLQAREALFQIAGISPPHS